MRRQTPPLEAAEAFILAARSVSFRAAADELALSPSAFSRRIQMLENFVGVPLFDRSGVSVRLTEAGQRYLAAISPAIDTIRRATVQMHERAGSRVLRLVTSHSFAMGWLMSRLPDLAQRHGIDVELSIGRDAQALRSGEADIAIWGGRPEGEDDLPHERLIDLSAVLAAAPRRAWPMVGSRPRGWTMSAAIACSPRRCLTASGGSGCSAWGMTARCRNPWRGSRRPNSPMKRRQAALA